MVRDTQRVPLPAKIRQPSPDHPRQPPLRQTFPRRLLVRHQQNHRLREEAPSDDGQDASARSNHRHRLRLPQRRRHARPRQPYSAIYQGTHAKLEVYMVEEDDPASIYQELATPNILKRAVFVVMLDFTAPWQFVTEFEKWIKFIK